MITVPTKEEVDARYTERAPADMLGFEVDEYTPYMSVEGMRPLAKEGVTDETLKEIQLTLNRGEMVADMERYMEFAIGKANDQRGISANRSIQHYIAWTWLSGDAEFSSTIETMYEHGYTGWGIPILRKICEFYGFDHFKEEDS
ncbi:MAG: hypothetical protein BA864_14155 [Desulfuromonadales bacterium C00003093]|nr:MAG: hypothetical protein BA864_14155 [Desulfuromonadales bacterium C00003093]